MNIGIDMDGVLFDTESEFRALAFLFNTCKFNGKIIDPETIRNQYRFDWSQEQFEEFMGKTLIPIHSTAPVMPFAKKVIQLLKENGHKIYSITARGSRYKEEINVTERRLKEENITFDKILYVKTSEKLQACQELNIDIMIDDLYETIDLLSDNNIDCLYYRDVVLKFIDKPNVREVRNWGEVYTELVKRNILPLVDIDEFIEYLK